MKIALPLLALIVFARTASAVVIEVPLPALVGTYTDESRTVTVQLPSTPSAIHGVSLRFAGTTSLGTWSCDGSNGYGPPLPVPVQVEATFYAPPGGWFAEPRLEATGPVSATVPFFPVLGATWDFLLDGTADLNFGLWGEPAILECILVGPPDVTVLSEVTLLVDGDFSTPARASSWGHVKAIYR